jgi:E3 ubiquitin-protein ligase TRIP12
LSTDSKRSSPSLLARQLRLRLIAEEGSDVPRNLNNIVVSIHAIATFQALHDYLRPRVSGILSGSSRLSSMLAALAAAGASSSSGPATAASPTKAEGTTDVFTNPAGGVTVARRRSQRLKTKTDTQTLGEASSSGDMTEGQGTAESVDDNTTGDGGISRPPLSAISAAVASEVAGSETVANDDDHAAIEANFSDEEVDAEVSHI